MTLTACVSIQAQLAWEATSYFRYNIESVVTDTDPATGQRLVGVLFSITNPADQNRYWDLKTEAPFKQSPALSRIAIGIGWNTKDYHNTGSRAGNLSPAPFGGGVGAALPISINALTQAQPVGGKYLVTAKLPLQATGTGVVMIEGHPAWPVTVNGQVVYQSVPVKSVCQEFAITDSAPVSRRAVVALSKCQACHDGNIHGGEVIPRLSLHGGNRTEELGVCVVCHNPSQTDIPYRTSGAEVSVDFKTMVHGIHGNKRRQNPLVIVGHLGTVYDFGYVHFPSEVRDCARCHIEVNGKGTYELPLAKNVMGTTIHTGSVPGSLIDVDPANDIRISPTAAVCSSCHDSAKAKSHISSRTAGGSFATTQAQLDRQVVVEKCVNCHGPGKDKSVRKVHSVGDSSISD
jgi:OmcA/MtrC family decaheme c-type cytochrome